MAQPPSAASASTASATPAPAPQVASQPAASPAPATVDCRNCFQPLGPGDPRFCPYCGQETTLRPPTLFEFAQQFGGAIVSTEGALWRTLTLLVRRPGELTRQYLAGRRKHYVAPVRLYLTASVVALLLLRLTAGNPSDMSIAGGGIATRIPDDAKIHIDLGGAKARRRAAEKTDGGAQKDASTTSDAAAEESGKASDKPVAPEKTDKSGDNIASNAHDERFTCEGAPQWVCDRIARRFAGDDRQVERAATEIGERFVANVGTLMFVLLPCFALFTKLAWWRRDLRYTEHLVFALHLHAFWFLALMLTAPGWWWLSLPAVAWMAVYAVRAMKTVFGGRRWTLALRAAAISFLYACTLGAGFAILGLVVALT